MALVKISNLCITLFCTHIHVLKHKNGGGRREGGREGGREGEREGRREGGGGRERGREGGR